MMILFLVRSLMSYNASTNTYTFDAFHPFKHDGPAAHPYPRPHMESIQPRPIPVHPAAANSFQTEPIPFPSRSYSATWRRHVTPFPKHSHAAPLGHMSARDNCRRNIWKNSFFWFGGTPRVIVTDPELIKDVFNKVYDFPKPDTNPLIKLLVNGLAGHDGEKWSKHRRIINPAFHLEKLKIMVPIFFKSCNDMINKWEKMLSSNGSCEIDVWPFLQNMASDVISRAAFGSSYEEGIRIFELQKEQLKLTMEIIMTVYIPGWRFLPTPVNRRMKEIHREIKTSLKDIINKKEKALKAGETAKDDLLGILLESNYKEIEEHGKKKNNGMSLEDVIDECKLFYFAGQETTSVLLVWTMVLLSKHSHWQARAREEVFQVFGSQKPHLDGLNRLKIVTMILYEVLRLYPPVLGLTRNTGKDMKLGDLNLPEGVQIYLPIVLVHHDVGLWGDNAKEFDPERFSEGVFKATNGKASFFPFGWGPRICIGQNFSLLEAKMALSLILQHFSFELSPAYTHAPMVMATLHPQYGAHIILRKVKI
ncbi:cytochrome P450 72A68-like isoform X2 [Arachis stenosperma]|uniref:cytochrome P450 72A68-like isoform X2 n=1 Tax=Arachis stenosperma TaxID=217475 RepID=UPI0025ACE8F5|nr:cytochrome P450 72A68-like isoform X2 [Arachis stenosperma]